jgi:DNA-binding response OmpR family regulator
MRILLVTGDAAHERVTRVLLESVGYRVAHVEDERGLRDRLGQGQFDLILLDASCRNMDGYELCREMRVSYRTPVIFLVADRGVAGRVNALRHGADDVLSKPYEPTELLARIEAVMRRYDDEFDLLGLRAHIRRRTVHIQLAAAD